MGGFDVNHARATLLSLGAVNINGVPVNGQVATWFDLDTIEGSANFTFDGTTLVLTGNQTTSGFHSFGAIPSLTGSIRLSNVSSIIARNQNDNGDFNVISFDASANMVIGDPGMPNIFLRADETELFDSLVVVGQANAQRTAIGTAIQTVSTPSGQTATATNLIPAGTVLVGITTRVLTTVTGPAGFDIGDGVDVDRWGNSIAVAAGTTSNITDATTGAIEAFPVAQDVVLTSDGVDFTGGSVRVIAHFLLLTAPTS